ncbi:unnamed protein product [Larinioides sclopetarius]|uniref:Uncharacterized protein n=1 Tax=Larinioides sclopetarius TaxID=280406 RepID=A0AAV2BMW3_9ARAC
MAYMPLNYEYPNLYVVYIEPTRNYSLERDPIFLLIEEVIDYSLRHHNLHNWIPPVNLYVARSLNVITYFNENFASSVISPDMEEQAMRLARSLGFDEERWLEFIDDEEARHYQEYYLFTIFRENRPCLFQMFSFACYSSRKALQRNRPSLVTDVVWALLAVLREILSYEEYYRRFYCVVNVHNDQHRINRSHDVDEGIGGIADEDNSSSGNGIRLPFFPANAIFLFVEELIDYSLRYDNLNSWIPAVKIETLLKTEIRYFTENIGRAVTHSCTIENAVLEAHDRGFEEKKWLDLYKPSEARNFQDYFFRELTNAVILGLNNVFLIFSFAYYSSKLAIQQNRNGLVNEVASALFYFLSERYPHQQHYTEFDREAIAYNRAHRHSDSVDDGVDGVENEVVDFEENNEDLFEEEASSHSDREQNENERDSESSMVGNEAEEGSGLDTSKEGSELDTSKEGSELDTSKEGSELDTSKEGSELDTSKEGSELDTSKEGSELDTSKEGSELDTSKEGSELDTSKEGSELDTSKEGSELDTSKEGSGLDTSKEGSGLDTSKEGSGLDTSKEGSGLDTSKEGSGLDTSKEGSGLDTSKEGSGLDTSKEGSGLDTSKEGSGLDTSKEGSGLDTSKEGSGLDTSKEGSGLDTSEENT